jgi:hypothetical protein
MAATPQERIKMLEMQQELIRLKTTEKEIALKNNSIRVQLRELKLKQKDVEIGSLLSKQRRNYMLATMNPATAMFFKQMSQSIEKSLEDRTRSLAFGRTQLDLLKGGKKEKFESGMGGFLTQAEVNLQGLEAGITDLPDSLRDLGASMMLTGQDSKKLMASMRRASVVGGLTNEQMDSLSKAVTNSSETYGTKAETIVNALDGVSEGLLKFNLLDTAGSFQEAIAEVAGKLGEGAEERISSLVGELTNRESIDDQIRLGIERLVSDMMKSTDAKEQANLLEEIIRKTGDQTKSVTQRMATGNNLTQNALSVSEDLYGKIGQEGNALNNMIKRQARDESDRKKANDQFQAQMNQSMSKIQSAMYDGGGTVAEFMSKNTDILMGIAAGITLLNVLMAKNQIANLAKEGLGKYKDMIGNLTMLKKGGELAKEVKVGEAATKAAGSIEDVASAAGKAGKSRLGGLVKGGGVLLLGTVLATKLYDMWEDSNKKEEERLKGIESSLSNNKSAANEARAKQLEKNINYDTRRNQLQQIREQMRFSNENSPLQSVNNPNAFSTQRVPNTGNLSDINITKGNNNGKEYELVTYTSTGGRTDDENEEMYRRAKSRGEVDFSTIKGRKVDEEIEMFRGRSWAEQQQTNEYLKQIAEASGKTAKNTVKAQERPSPTAGVRRSE